MDQTQSQYNKSPRNSDSLLVQVDRTDFGITKLNSHSGIIHNTGMLLLHHSSIRHTTMLDQAYHLKMDTHTNSQVHLQ